MTLTGNERKRLEWNITINLLNQALGWSRFFMPVMALFYIASQVTLEEFTILFAVFAFVTLVLEIPSGVFADRVGKKKTIILANTLFVIEVLFLSFFNGFWLLLLAKIISGVGVSLSSGAKEAMLYDSLKRLNREHEHKRISGLAHTIQRSSMAFVFIIGSFLFSLHPKLPAFMTLPFLGTALLVSLFYFEPFKPVATTSFKHFAEGMNYVRNHASIKYIIVYSIPLAAAINMLFNLSSFYYVLIAIPIVLVGLFQAFQTVFTATSSYFTYQIEEKLGVHNSLFLVQLLTVLGILLMMFLIPWAGLIPFYMISFAFGIYYVLTNHYVNEHASTSHRATILSIRNMFNQLAIVILFPIVGFISSVSFSLSMFFLFAVTIACVGISFFFEKPAFFQ